MHFGPACLILNDFCTGNSRCCVVQTSHGTKSLARAHPAAPPSQQSKTRRGSGVCRSIAQVHRFIPKTRETRPQCYQACACVLPAPEESQPPAPAFQQRGVMEKPHDEEEPRAASGTPPRAGSRFQGEAALGNGSLTPSCNLQGSQKSYKMLVGSRHERQLCFAF